jgi:hypothetical protein
MRPVGVEGNGPAPKTGVLPDCVLILPLTTRHPETSGFGAFRLDKQRGSLLKKHVDNRAVRPLGPLA